MLRLQDAEIAKVPESIADMRNYRRWTNPGSENLLEPGRTIRIESCGRALPLLAS